MLFFDINKNQRQAWCVLTCIPLVSETFVLKLVFAGFLQLGKRLLVHRDCGVWKICF